MLRRSHVGESGAEVTTFSDSALPPASDHLHGSLGRPGVEDLHGCGEEDANPGVDSGWLFFSGDEGVEDGGPEIHDEEPDDVDEGQEPGVDVAGNHEAVEPSVDLLAVGVRGAHDEENSDGDHGGKGDRWPDPGEEGDDGAEVRQLGGPRGHEDEHPDGEDPGGDTVGEVSTPVVGWVVVVGGGHDEWAVHI